MMYGTTPTGLKIHMGDTYVHNSSLNELMIRTKCGNYMWDNARRDPAQGDLFCASCFRSEAWQMFQDHLRRVKSG